MHRKEVFDGRGTALFGALFEVFSQKDEGDDDCGRFEVKWGWFVWLWFEAMY